ncbi:hypothetical protein [Frigoribacterium sp. ME-P-080]|uniref:hypothetical protein n=1 Tax=Frigoribacterium sp. ME-P-080 TaxID=3040289 RepID=UPI00255182E4|nr:hypothetical protein [Frigoribacterium sp. ME-P-080]
MIEHLPHIIRSDRLEHGRRESEAVRRGVERGEFVRVRRGAAVDAAAWRAASSRDRHLILVLAVMPRLASRMVVSHASAAACWELPALGEWPSRVHVVDPDRRTTQTTANVVRHPGPLSGEEVRSIPPLSLTSPARTAADLALTSSFRDAVVALDALVRRGLASADDVRHVLDGRGSARGLPSARRAVAFATPEAESPGESLTRVVLHELGAPPPVLQQRFTWGDGGLFADVVDFWWPRFGVVLEFDGRIKYAEGRWKNGRSPGQVVVDEKIREDRIRNRPEVNGFARTVWDELSHPPRLAANLRSAGLPLP